MTPASQPLHPFLRTSGGQVEVLWKKQGMEALDIQKDTSSDSQLLALSK